MSLTAAAIRALADKGLSAFDIADIAEANEPERSSAAIRQKRYRDNKRGVTRDVTPSPNEIDILTPTRTPVISDEITAPAENDDEPIREEHVIEAWNAMAGEAGLPKARMTPERRKKLKTFIRRHSVDDITEAIWRIPQTPFLRGENDRGWKPGIDFLLQPSSFTKLLERTYG